MKFDLSDWDRRKAQLAPVLHAAVSEGVIRPEQASRLSEFLLGRGVGLAAAAALAPSAIDNAGLGAPRIDNGAAPLEDSEAPRFIRGFHDILITIGIVVVLLGIGGLMSVYAVLPAVIALAEILVRRQRLALPAVVLTIAFAVAAGFSILSVLGERLDDDWSVAAILGAVAAASLAFYWRYKAPIALSGGLVGLYAALASLASIAVRVLSRDDKVFENHPPLLSLLLGVLALALFATALRFDFADRNRLTRRSDVAFWIHLAAAPAILYTILSFVYSRSEGWFSADTNIAQAAVIIAAVAVLMLIGIVLDRRAFVTSGLLSFGYAFNVLLSQGGFAGLFQSADMLFFAILIITGVIVLSLGIGWQSLRRIVVERLPAAMADRLPPARA